MFKTEDLVTSEFKKDQALFYKGEPPDGYAYLIKSGSVGIMSNAGGQDVRVATLERGDFVGEMALIDNLPRSATAIAEETTICAVVTKADIDKALEDADLLAFMLVKTLTRRLRKTTERADLFFDDDDDD